MHRLGWTALGAGLGVVSAAQVGLFIRLPTAFAVPSSECAEGSALDRASDNPPEDNSSQAV